MKLGKKQKKLVLNKISIAHLDKIQIAEVKGGLPAVSTEPKETCYTTGCMSCGHYSGCE